MTYLALVSSVSSTYLTTLASKGDTRAGGIGRHNALFEDIEKRTDAKIDNLPMYSIAIYSATLPPDFWTFHLCSTW